MQQDLGQKDQDQNRQTQEENHHGQYHVKGFGHVLDDCHDGQSGEEGLKHGENGQSNVLGLGKLRFNVPGPVGLPSRNGQDEEVDHRQRSQVVDCVVGPARAVG